VDSCYISVGGLGIDQKESEVYSMQSEGDEMKWHGTIDELEDIFETNKFEIEGLQPTKKARRFRIKDTQFSLFDTGTLTIQGRGSDYMQVMTRRLLKGDERFTEE
jgi:hypothetical protein